MTTQSLSQRFWSKVNKTPGQGPKGDCWEWKAGRHPKGYGLFKARGTTLRAHRLAWELANGPIPDGLQSLHRCDNPPCCRPDHLFLGTNDDNVADMVAKGRQRGATLERHGSRLHPESRPRGENHTCAKVEATDIKAIRQSTASTSELARQYPLSRRQIDRIRSGEKWAHV